MKWENILRKNWIKTFGEYFDSTNEVKLHSEKVQEAINSGNEEAWTNEFKQKLIRQKAVIDEMLNSM